MFPFLTGFHSLFPIHHSLVFHLISSQFPTLLRHLFIWSIIIFCFLLVESGDFIKTRLFCNGKRLQVKAPGWQPLPLIPTPAHSLTLTPTVVNWSELNHLWVMLRSSCSLGVGALHFREPPVSRTHTHTYYYRTCGHLGLGAHCCTAPRVSLDIITLVSSTAQALTGNYPDLLLCVLCAWGWEGVSCLSEDTFSEGGEIWVAEALR